MKKMFVTEPYLLTLKPSEVMNIVWIQREPVQGIVEYGFDSNDLKYSIKADLFDLKGIRVPASEAGYTEEPEENPQLPLWQCIAKVEGLQPGQKVYYRCKAGEYTTQEYHFCMAPKEGEDYRFAQLSDLQGTLGCDKAAWEIGCEKPDFLLYSGDCVHVAWQATDWFDLEEPWQDEDAAKCTFFACLQQQNGAELMQYCPLFICPGNHEMDDIRVGRVKEICSRDESWNWSIYMQLFRPLYEDTDTTLTGKRWYSADYSDLHIVSLSVQRYAWWGAYEAPGWRVADAIAPGSPQITWLQQDLQNTKAKFKWVILHWHLLNKGDDVQTNLCEPEIDEEGKVVYPYDHGEYLLDLFEAGGVNAASFGHSHVYERYFAKGAHYIEAANFTVCYRWENVPIHPSGRLPIVEDNSRNSFLMIDRRKGGLFGTGYYLGMGREDGNCLAEDTRIFDRYQIADENGKSVKEMQENE